MKNHSTVAIPMFQNLGTNRWYYSFNQKQEMVKNDEGNDDVVFTADTVVISGEPDEAKVKKAMTSATTDKGDINPIVYEETAAPVHEDMSHVVSYTDDVYRSVLREDVAGLEWIANEIVHTGRRRDYAGKTWECIQYHITQVGWEPDKVPALWKEVYTGGGYPVWKQPTGAHDAYAIGTIVWYPTEGSTLYISKIAANVTVPDGDEPYNRYWEPYTP